MTRQQRYLTTALSHVDAVRPAEGAKDPVRARAIMRAYGGLCHELPILVRANGLAQTLAWVEEKATSAADQSAPPLAVAYGRLREHIAVVLGVVHQDGGPNPAQLLPTVCAAPTQRYMRYTIAILDAWVYYKRFAASLLGVDDAAAVRDPESTA